MIYLSIILFFAFVFLSGTVFFIILLKKYNYSKNDLNKILLAAKRVRYGDINVRIENLCDKDLETAVNRLFETMYDREMMIKEYQSTLAKKNLTLEEIIKQEKQLQLFKEEFAATLTHDMKVPVIAELNSLNYLIEGRFGPLTDKQAEILNLMKNSNQELKDLIENMLETYKLEQKTLSLNFTNNNVNEFINSIVKEMYPIAVSTSHSIKTDLSATENIFSEFDNMQMKRVFKNLIQNAISFSPESSDINIKSDNQETKIKFYITNKGSGISKEELELIFQKYYSGQSKFKKAGTGLGLYLAQQLVLAHNGKIEADCSKDGFTTFVLTLPKNKE